MEDLSFHHLRIYNSNLTEIDDSAFAGPLESKLETLVLEKNELRAVRG